MLLPAASSDGGQPAANHAAAAKIKTETISTRLAGARVQQNLAGKQNHEPENRRCRDWVVGQASCSTRLWKFRPAIAKRCRRFDAWYAANEFEEGLTAREGSPVSHERAHKALAPTRVPAPPMSRAHTAPTPSTPAQCCRNLQLQNISRAFERVHAGWHVGAQAQHSQIHDLNRDERTCIKRREIEGA